MARGEYNNPVVRLIRLDIDRARNLDAARLAPGPGLNLVLGDNGCGKTSLLECIYILAMARSFRTPRLSVVGRWGETGFVLFGEFVREDGRSFGVGVEKDRGAINIRLAGKPVEGRAELAKAVPLSYIGSESLGFFDKGPSFRRRQLDWGVFHGIAGYHQAWKRYQRALRQCNVALKQGAACPALAPWRHQMGEAGMIMDQMRRAYLELFGPRLERLIGQLLGDNPILLRYAPGWSPELELEAALADACSRDQRQGYVTVGPHRADLVITQSGVNAQAALSRGQQKLYGIAFLLAQVETFRAIRDGNTADGAAAEPIVLFDDLQAELDSRHQQLVLQQLMDSAVQSFVTVTAMPPVDPSPTLFQVTRGKVQMVV